MPVRKEPNAIGARSRGLGVQASTRTSSVTSTLQGGLGQTLPIAAVTTDDLMGHQIIGPAGPPAPLRRAHDDERGAATCPDIHPVRGDHDHSNPHHRDKDHLAIRDGSGWWHHTEDVGTTSNDAFDGEISLDDSLRVARRFGVVRQPPGRRRTPGAAARRRDG